MKFQLSEYTTKELEELTVFEIPFCFKYLKGMDDERYKILKERQKYLSAIRHKKRRDWGVKNQKESDKLKDLDNKRKFKEGPKRNKKFWAKLKESDKEKYKQHFLDLEKKQRMKNRKKILKGPIHKPRL